MAQTIQPAGSGATKTVPASTTPVTSDQALASLIEAQLVGSGDGGAAAVAWYEARRPKPAKA